MATKTDGIEKKILSRERVWRAISDSTQSVVGSESDSTAPSSSEPALTVRLLPARLPPKSPKSRNPTRERSSSFTIDRVEPTHLFAFRWHPFAVEAGVDYSKEPSTLVVFELGEVTGGGMLTVIEFGFDQIPLQWRARAFSANQEGWTARR